MAEAPPNLELLLQCQICLEEFDEEGDHVPRLLPCTHTLCHTCVGKLIHGNRIECPKCRKKHKVTNNEESFPQNKYILIMLKRKSFEEQPTPNDFKTCDDHGEDLNMFCKNAQCNNPVCRTCLRKQHKGHVAFPIKEQEKDVLLKDLAKIIPNLEAKLESITDAKNYLGTRRKLTVEEITKRKEEFVKYFDEMIKKTEKKTRKRK